jgi:putative membrane protein
MSYYLGKVLMMRDSIPIAAAAGTALVLVPTWVWAQGPSETDRYAYGPHMMWWGGGWYGMVFGPLIMILVLAVVIAAAVLLVRGIGGSWPGMTPPDRTPLDTLKERYARGEIDREEYMRRRTDLQD